MRLAAVRPWTALVALFAVQAVASASSLTLEATVEAVEARGYVLRVGQDLVPVEDASRTRFWSHRTTAERGAFHAGDAVWVRIKTDVAPAELREIADRESWTWLEEVRHGFHEGTVRNLDAKYATIDFPDGTHMAYRITPKSRITIGGADVGVEGLKVGQRLWVKGRSLATLDLMLAEASDTAPKDAEKVVKPKATKTPKEKTPKAKPLPATGTIESAVEDHKPGWHIFDVEVDGVRLHVTYTPTTIIQYQGKRATPTSIEKGRKARVDYRRDRFGRIVASRVDLSP